MERNIFMDFETRSAVDLRTAGVDAYAQHPTTGIWCLCWAYNDEPVQVWRPEHGETGQLDYLFGRIRDGWTVVAHNWGFEAVIWNTLVAPSYWAPELTPEHGSCTMARAQMMALPAGLDMLATVLRLPVEKDKDGYGLMLRMCRPRSTAGDGTPVWWDVPDRVERLIAYCKQDVMVERMAHKLLLPLPPLEQKIWELDYRINRRGVKLDRATVQAATRLVAIEARGAGAEASRLTDGGLSALSNINTLKAFINWDADLGVTSLDKRTVQSLLKRDDLSAVARELLGLRQAVGKTSVAKLRAMDKAASTDDRIRGMFRYHAASTGRWAGARVQLQNLPRPHPDITQKDLAAYFEGFEGGELNFDGLRSSLGARGISMLEMVATGVRGMLVPAEGYEFITGDYSNIEGRVCAWLAGDEAELEAFRAQDRGDSADLYKLEFHKTFGVPVDQVTKQQRQVGKVKKLALQYQGALGAFAKMGEAYGITVIESGADDFDKLILTHATVRRVVDSWREDHPAIVDAWAELEEAFRRALQQRSVPQPALNGKVTYLYKPPLMGCKLPSGRWIYYVRPRVGTYRKEGQPDRHGTILYGSMDSVTKRWDEQKQGYGGLFMENITQAAARDAFTAGMLNVERAGYPIVMHVHDEIVSEVPKGSGSEKEFEMLACKLPGWAEGLPVVLQAERLSRYSK